MVIGVDSFEREQYIMLQQKVDAFIEKIPAIWGGISGPMPVVEDVKEILSFLENNRKLVDQELLDKISLIEDVVFTIAKDPTKAKNHFAPMNNAVLKLAQKAKQIADASKLRFSNEAMSIDLYEFDNLVKNIRIAHLLPVSEEEEQAYREPTTTTAKPAFYQNKLFKLAAGLTLFVAGWFGGSRSNEQKAEAKDTPVMALANTPAPAQTPAPAVVVKYASPPIVAQKAASAIDKIGDKVVGAIEASIENIRKTRVNEAEKEQLGLQLDLVGERAKKLTDELEIYNAEIKRLKSELAAQEQETEAMMDMFLEEMMDNDNDDKPEILQNLTQGDNKMQFIPKYERPVVIELQTAQVSFDTGLSTPSKPEYKFNFQGGVYGGKDTGERAADKKEDGYVTPFAQFAGEAGFVSAALAVLPEHVGNGELENPGFDLLRLKATTSLGSTPVWLGVDTIGLNSLYAIDPFAVDKTTFATGITAADTFADGIYSKYVQNTTIAGVGTEFVGDTTAIKAQAGFAVDGTKVTDNPAAALSWTERLGDNYAANLAASYLVDSGNDEARINFGIMRKMPNNGTLGLNGYSAFIDGENVDNGVEARWTGDIVPGKGRFVITPSHSEVDGSHFRSLFGRENKGVFMGIGVQINDEGKAAPILGTSFSR